jgi:hypothetical protein
LVIEWHSLQKFLPMVHKGEDKIADIKDNKRIMLYAILLIYILITSYRFYLKKK